MSSRVTTTVCVLIAVFFAVAGSAAAVVAWMSVSEQRVLEERLDFESHQRQGLQRALVHASHRAQRLEAVFARLATERFAADEQFLSEELASLVGLTRSRLELMTDVARAKWNAGRPIEDLERETALLDDLAFRAREAHVDPEAVRTFFADQIAAAKIVQRERFAAWKAAGQKEFADAPGLNETLRPRIDEITDQLLKTYLSLEPYLGSPALAAAVDKRLSSEPASEDIPAGARRHALRSLVWKPVPPSGRAGNGLDRP